MYLLGTEFTSWLLYALGIYIGSGTKLKILCFNVHGRIETVVYKVIENILELFHVFEFFSKFEIQKL